jgi:general secretion pathway protein F
VPTFRYTGVSREGVERKGVVDAESVSAARLKLRTDGTYPVSLTEVTAAGRLFPSLSLLGRQEFLPLVTRQLATLVEAGVPVVSALQSISAQVDDPESRRVLGEIQESVRSGMSLARAVETHARMFPELYGSMVRAGEESGTLGLSLSRLANHLEEQARTINRVRSALTYPMIMASVAGLVVVFLLSFVVPKIVGVFSNLGQALPLPTRALIAVSNVFAAGWWVLLLLLGGLVLAGRRYLATDRGKRARDAFLLRLPILGKIVHLSALSRFARTLSTMTAGGIPIDRALRLVGPAVGNTVIADGIEAAAARVVEGSSLSEGLRQHALIPPTLIQMVAVGEESGKLDYLLDKMGEAIDGEVEARLSRALSLLEPVIILVMGVVVAFIVISVLLPMLEISTIVR